MKTRGRVRDDAWRARDLRRAVLIYALGGVVAAAVTVLLYFV